MKLHLFQELLALNEEFEHVIRALERMEKVPTYRSEMIRWARAHVESAQVEANRQFFDEFEAIVENDALAAYKFLSEHKKRITDPDDIYLEIRHREEERKAKGLPPRLIILPDWEFNDEKRYEREQAEIQMRKAKRPRKTMRKRSAKRANPTQPPDGDSRMDSTRTQEEDSNQ